jgi:hypothetical protein
MPLPKYLDKFSDDAVDNLIKSGSIKTKFDDYGVISIDKDETSISSSIITFPLTLDVYNDVLLSNNFETAFEEFVIEPSTEESIESEEEAAESADVASQNETIAELEATVSDLETQLEESGDNQAFVDAGKDEIIRLRIELGQGSSPSDFNDSFPYLPLNDPENDV